MGSDHYFSASPGSQARPRTIHVRLAGADREVTTASGIFSPDRIDTGTQVLLASMPPPPPSGNLLDLGCGWGPLALTLALDAPHATVWAVDVNDRALGLVAANAQRLGLENVRTAHPDEVPEDITFATIWSNPPIRVGKHELHDMLENWMQRLSVGSDAWLVVQRNLGADSLHHWLQGSLPPPFSVLRTATNKGFRVLRVRHRTPNTPVTGSDRDG